MYVMASNSARKKQSRAVDDFVNEIAVLDVKGAVIDADFSGVRSRFDRDNDRQVIEVSADVADSHSWDEVKDLIRERREADESNGYGW